MGEALTERADASQKMRASSPILWQHLWSVAGGRKNSVLVPQTSYTRGNGRTDSGTEKSDEAGRATLIDQPEPPCSNAELIYQTFPSVDCCLEMTPVLYHGLPFKTPHVFTLASHSHTRSAFLVRVYALCLSPIAYFFYPREPHVGQERLET
ncbi:hypothetical protein EI94DRAFT_1755418 [Lactarius quietus]|nr:hypothetical protein EI94DRAFT_1755418 [Lactarius quietus]